MNSILFGIGLLKKYFYLYLGANPNETDGSRREQRSDIKFLLVNQMDFTEELGVRRRMLLGVFFVF